MREDESSNFKILYFKEDLMNDCLLFSSNTFFPLTKFRFVPILNYIAYYFYYGASYLPTILSEDALVDRV